jgi:hypothetical protein
MIALLSSADGGSGYGRTCNVKDLEPTFNLFYSSLEGKIKTLKITSNIAIYDIAQNQISISRHIE